jgi:hypothetical protein
VIESESVIYICDNCGWMGISYGVDRDEAALNWPLPDGWERLEIYEKPQRNPYDGQRGPNRFDVCDVCVGAEPSGEYRFAAMVLRRVGESAKGGAT